MPKERERERERAREGRTQMRKHRERERERHRAVEPIPQIANPKIVKPIRHRSSRTQKLSNPFATDRREPRNRRTIRQTQDRPAESSHHLLGIENLGFDEFGFCWI